MAGVKVLFDVAQITMSDEEREALVHAFLRLAGGSDSVHGSVRTLTLSQTTMSDQEPRPG